MKSIPIILVLFLIGFGAYVAIKSFRGEGILTFVHLPQLASGPTLGERIEAPKMSVGAGGAVAPAPIPIPPAGFTVAQLSPFYKKVQFSSVVHPYSVNDSRATFSLVADYSLDRGIDITGWQVKGNGAYGITIPAAVADFQSLMIMYVSAYQGKDHIMVQPGGMATFYTMPSPMKGVSLRLNKCTGYLNESYAFSPSIPNDCPRPEIPRATLLSGKCQDYVHSLYACRTPSLDSINASLDQNETECRAFAQRLNYDGCYATYRNDADFFSREWRVWLNQYMPFDLRHDRLVLYDAQGLVVNEYVY